MLNFPGFTSENHLLYQILLSLSPFSRLLSQVFCLMSPASCLLSHVSVSHLISLSHIFCLLSCVSYLSTVSRVRLTSYFFVSHLLSPVLCILSIYCLTSPVSVCYVSFLTSPVPISHLLTHNFCLLSYI